MPENRIPLSRMNLSQLVEYAQSLGIDVGDKPKKAEVSAKIVAVTGPAKRGRPRKSDDPSHSEEENGHVHAAQKTQEHSTPNQQEETSSFSRQNRRGRSQGRSTSATAFVDPITGEMTPREAPARPRTTEDIVLPERSEGETRPRRGRERTFDRSRRARVERAQERYSRANRPSSQEEEERRASAIDAVREMTASMPQAQEVADEENTAEARPRRGRNPRQNREHSPREGRDNRDMRENRHESGEENLIPVAGIIDFQGNQAFLRTGGYLPGANDAIVSSHIVKQYGLRRGDAVVGAVRQRHESENRGRQNRKYNNNKDNNFRYNPLVHVESINSLDPEQSMLRPQFSKLTPVYPNEMLRMEIAPKGLTGRAIDLVAPIGKGQRGLIVSPPKAGKTIVMQQIAQAIAQNNPNVHLMVVLVDERPEEVTDMERLVKGEVIASTFDRPASDHAIVAELAIERAKRLVELGSDVVVLLDSLTRLSRAYNLAAPASGRILSGGVDAAALYPPKKFFGAARNIENGGSLTIIASALVETGSKMDEVIFEEFKGTGNMELRLSRELADRRIFPAIDVNASGTRREELLFTKEELKVIWQLRRALGTLDVQEASDTLLGRLRHTENNADVLVQVMRSMQAANKGR